MSRPRLVLVDDHTILAEGLKSLLEPNFDLVGIFADGRDVLVADSAAAFAEAVVRLHEDEALWKRLADGGRENVVRHFSAQAARPVLATLVNDAVARSERHAAAALDARS